MLKTYTCQKPLKDNLIFRFVLANTSIAAWCKRDCFLEGIHMTKRSQYFTTKNRKKLEGLQSILIHQNIEQTDI